MSGVPTWEELEKFRTLDTGPGGHEIPVADRLDIEVYDKHGRLKSRAVGRGGSITNRGRQFISRTVFQAASQPIGAQYVAWGTNFTAFASGNTGLGTEIQGGGLDRALASYAYTAFQTFTQVRRTYRATATLAVRECGVFGTVTSVAGTLLARQRLSTVQNIASADSIRAIWTFSH